MPLFEYQCGACGRRFEVLAAAGSRAPACPDCGAPRAKKLLSVFSASTARPAAPAACGAGSCPAAGNCPGLSGGCGCPM